MQCGVQRRKKESRMQVHLHIHPYEYTHKTQLTSAQKVQKAHSPTRAPAMTTAIVCLHDCPTGRMRDICQLLERERVQWRAQKKYRNKNWGKYIWIKGKNQLAERNGKPKRKLKKAKRKKKYCWNTNVEKIVKEMCKIGKITKRAWTRKMIRGKSLPGTRKKMY